MFKFLAFAISAAEAPVPHNMTREINRRVQRSGAAKNIKTWMFWTPPQLEMLSISHYVDKVCFVSGNGVGKTILMLEQAMELVKKGQIVLFCIKSYGNIKSLLQMKFENYFKNTNVIVLGITKIEDLQTQYDLHKTYIFIDECPESWILELNNIQAKSIWIALGELESYKNQKSMELRNRNSNLEAFLELFKKEYGQYGWYFPFNSLTLRTTQTNSKTFTKWSKRFSEPEKPEKGDCSVKSNDKLMIGSLNKYLNFPNNAQIGPEPTTMTYGKDIVTNDAKTITDILQNILLGGTYNPIGATALIEGPKILDSERILIVKEWKLGVNSEEIDEAKKFLKNNPEALYDRREASAKKMEDNFIKILVVVLNILQKCNRAKPLIWLQEYPHYCSDEMDIKKWIDGKMQCDLITDCRSTRGFEEPVVLHLGESNRMFGETILSRSIVKFLWINYDNPENVKGSSYDIEEHLKDMTISHDPNDHKESDRTQLVDEEIADLMQRMLSRFQ